MILYYLCDPSRESCKRIRSKNEGSEGGYRIIVFSNDAVQLVDFLTDSTKRRGAKEDTGRVNFMAAQLNVMAFPYSSPSAARAAFNFA